MTLVEKLLKPFLPNEETNIELSSKPDEEKIEQSLDDTIPTGFFDGNNSSFTFGNKKESTIREQNNLINEYRRISIFPEVSDAISEIVDEAIFSPGVEDIIVPDYFGDLPTNLEDKITKELDELQKMMNIRKNIYSLFESFYIDGQLNIHCVYDKNNVSSGIQRLNVLSPLGLYFNYSKNQWEYSNLEGTSSKGDKTFDREEIIRVDSGIYSNNLILSNLHYAIKTANMLNSLEDMLIPMRFTRSVSRRVFNVDVSGLNNKKAEEYMQKIQAKFKYNKFYNLETGTISNQQHVSSLVEDYWFANRDGSKGTTIDTIDETGNLGEISDIMYFKRKLYTSLKVPTNRINDDGSQADFDYDATAISREELKFFNFISRLRNQFLDIFYELLKRQCISKGIVKPSEWEEVTSKMRIKFLSENKFFEKMEREKLSTSLGLYTEIQDHIGKIFTYEYVFKNIFKMSDDDIKELANNIDKEPSNPLYKRFYEKSEDDDF